MCLACEEGDLHFRWQLVEQIAKGEMPAGHTADDLRAMGLPPGELIREQQPDGSFLIRQVAPKKAAPSNAFVCDSPE